jgi:imidazolonepropionase-like amidohydrolase
MLLKPAPNSKHFVMRHLRLVLLLLVTSVATAGYEVPGELPAGAVILEHATIHTANEVIEDGVLVMNGGKIKSVGKFSDSADEKSEGKDVGNDRGDPSTTIDLSGKHLFPGLINADSAIGLVEIDSVRATLDFSEVGSINPNVRGGVAFNPDSELIPVARAGGVLLSLCAPRGGFVCGQSSLMRLDGWTGAKMTMVPVVGIHVRWPSASRRRRGSDDSANKERADRRAKQFQEFRDLLMQARLYDALTKKEPKTPFDARLAAMSKLTSGDAPMFAHADGLQAIEEAVAFAQREKLKLVIVGGYDAPRCSALLKMYKVPVIVSGTQRNPRRRQADYDEPFRVPAELAKAGVKFCIAGNERFSASLIQNLADHAGTAAAHGLSVVDALRSITLYPAEILGVAARTGSLEVGKDATLLVTDGDILEVTTHVEQAWLEGRPVDLNNRHKRLWNKYKQRYQSP